MTDQIENAGHRRSEQGGIGGERTARGLLHPGTEDADADEGADDAEDLADCDDDLATSVRGGGLAATAGLEGG